MTFADDRRLASRVWPIGSRAQLRRQLQVGVLCLQQRTPGGRIVGRGLSADDVSPEQLRKREVRMRFAPFVAAATVASRYQAPASFNETLYCIDLRAGHR